MKDFVKRLLIAGIMAVFISLLFIGGKHPQAEMNDLKVEADHWMWPTDGVITDTYGTRNGRHHGIDIAGGLGTAVHAVDEGVVSKSYYSSSYGHVVFIKHPNQTETVYAHLNKRNVKEGQAVKQGEVIGKMGNTGRSSGVHLHFEVHKNEWTVNKENSLNPVAILGSITVGEPVQAMMEQKDNEQVAGVYESAEILNPEGKIQDEDVVLLENNHALLAVTPDAEKEEKAIETVKDDKSSNIVHIVQKGDNLWDIAERYDSSVGSIVSSNNLSDDEVIVPNQELIIKTSAVNEKYIIQPGDTLSSIAEEHDVDVEELKAINQLETDVIHPQQVLNIKKN